MTQAPPEKKAKKDPGDGTPEVIIETLADRYSVDSTGHYRVTRRGEIETHTEIVNARVGITAAYADDTGEPYPVSATEVQDRIRPVITHYDLTVSRRGEGSVDLPDVPADDFTRVAWIERAELAALPVATAGGQTARHDIMTAIKLSSPHPVIPAYGRLGWHYRSGEWFYVHGGGAWTATGPAEVRVHGDGLGVFTMAPPPEDATAGRRAFDALWGLFEMGPDRYAAVEIGAAFRASMGRPSGSITYRAINQSGKSGRMAFVTQCWAPSVRWNRLPFNAGKAFATPTYIEHVHHTFGDLIVPWDDMAPVGSPRERADYFDMFARSLFNGASKGRMGIQDRKIVARARLRPRAFGALSAEDLTAVESGQNRTHILPLTREEFDGSAFQAADAGTGPEDRSALMSAFIVWWAGRMPAHAYVAELETHYRAELEKATGAPGRYVESVADKAAGLHCGLAFARERGWVDPKRAESLWARAWAGLCESLRAQVDAIAGQSIPDRIRDAIYDGLATREAYVLGIDGAMPGEAHRFGWEGEFARGRMIGWTDLATLYLLPSAAGAFVTEYASRSGAPIEITPRAMGEALETAGYIKGSDRKQKGRMVHRHTVPKWILGQTKDVWALPVPVDSEGPEGGPGGGGGGSPETPAAPGAGPALCRGYVNGKPCGEPVTFDPDGTGIHVMCSPEPSGFGVGTLGAEEWSNAVPAPRQETPEQSAVPSLNESAGTAISAPSVTEAEEEVPSRPTLAWAVLDTDGSLILPDGSRRALPEGWLTEARHVGDLAALLQPERIRTLYVPAPVAALFDLPEEVGSLAWNEGLEHTFTESAAAAGWDVAPAGLSHWMTVYREGEKGNGGTIVFPAWDGSVDGWRTAGAEHVARTLRHVRELTGVHYFRSPQTTMGRLVASVERSHYRTPNLERIEAPEVRYELAGIYAPPVGKGIDLTDKWLHMFDVNAQYASACRGLDLATAPYEHVDRPEVPKYPAPGLWRLQVDVTELRPRAGLRPVIDPARIKRGARVWDGWVPTPTMTLLRDAGRKFEVLEAWVSPAKRRVLDDPMRIITEARNKLRDLSEVEGDAAHTAMGIVKMAYASWVNGTLRSTFNGNRREDDPWYRPDMTAMVQATADARKARLLIKAADIAPVHVITDETDCVVILSDDPSWETAVPGLALDPTANGKFKHAGSAPVTDEIASILRNEKRAKSGRCVDIKDAIKAYEGGGK